MIQAQPSKLGEEFPTKTRCGMWSGQITQDTFWQADIVGEVDSHLWALSMSYVTSQSGPSTFQIFGRSVGNRAQADVAIVPSPFPSDGLLRSADYGSSGNFTVATDMHHGSIDLILVEIGNPAKIHVVGLWRCA